MISYQKKSVCYCLGGSAPLNLTGAKKGNCKIMKRSGMFLLWTGMFLFVSINSIQAASYEVPTSTSIVDGDIFCGGSACTSSDIIIIKGGTRGALKFQDFDGAGSYITITNENTDPNSKVEIISDGGGGWGVLSLSHCKYVDLRGDNDGDITYGIKVINGTPARAGSVWVRGESDHIKIGYIEMAFDGNTTISGNGVFVQDGSLSAEWIYDTLEIHHNYIHGAKYAGMYLGQNEPWNNDNPYIKDFLVHNNTIDNSGCYAITLKGVHESSGVMRIYNNTIRITGVDCSVEPTIGASFRQGIGTIYYTGNTYAEIYGNRIEHTAAQGISIKSAVHKVYNNLILGCGTEQHPKFGNGINVAYGATYSEIHDNIIVQPNQYGIYAASGAGTGNYDERNIICNAGLGERYAYSEDKLIEGTGDDANIYEEDCANVGFTAWSDDGDYSNDDFSFGEPSYCGDSSCNETETCSSCPQDCGECPQTYTILKTSTPPIIDGNIDEFNSANTITLTNPRGTSGDYRLMWDANALYIAVDVSDTQLNADETIRDGSFGNDDLIEMMFDTLHDAGSSLQTDDYRFLVNILNTHADSRGGIGRSWNCLYNSVAVVSGTINDNGDTDIGYTIEIAILWTEWGISAPAENDVWGFEVVMNDQDETDTRIYTAWTNSGGEDLNVPDEWGTVTFSEEELPLVCPPGYMDCNGNRDDGCETNIDNDMDNCGECDNACDPGVECVGGKCASATGSEPGPTCGCQSDGTGRDALVAMLTLVAMLAMLLLISRRRRRSLGGGGGAEPHGGR